MKLSIIQRSGEKVHHCSMQEQLHDTAHRDRSSGRKLGSKSHCLVKTQQTIIAAFSFPYSGFAGSLSLHQGPVRVWQALFF